MLNRYRVRLTKKYDFDLDGTSEQDIREQVIYISDETQILKLPEVRKNIKMRIKKIHERRDVDEKHS